MSLFELIVSLLFMGTVLSAWARHVGIPYPAVLSLAGAAAALIPTTPEVSLQPELALALFVAPTLLDSAYDASLRDLRDNWVPIGALAIVAVVLTVGGVAVVARWMVPSIPWAAAIVLGAVVAPPDASAATAVLRQLRPPYRLMVILEGESLLNDATALLIYRVAVGAATGTMALGPTFLVQFLLATIGGGALGWALARLWFSLPFHRSEIPMSVLAQFLGTFAVWILASWLNVSAIITVVVYAMTIARIAPARMGARHRIASFAVWDVVVFVLNVLAFILIGLQLKSILHRLDSGVVAYVEVAATICLTVVVVRVLWVFVYSIGLRWKNRYLGEGHGRKLMRPTTANGLIISWCGMRGIVTLATALALPEAFPARDLIEFCAFSVVLATLVPQGLTVGPLLRRLHLPEDRSIEDEARLARAATARAAIRALETEGRSESAMMLGEEYAAREHSAMNESISTDLSDLQMKAVEVQRQALARLRRDKTIGDIAFHIIEEELDIIELTADPRVRARVVPKAPG
jgi:monovalent cation/hydrogen antiporter